ncbi:flagellar protein FliS [Virgisporangium aliadipatigenens]|uniref:Flagellar protein FliS n=1 Tax=Virgisporangium aliadipatigenens TaxID=741659 RepID=A0A8J3YVX4_9ACTN|nr:flagellar export chaperone FliS [Virgisporangium aliadipatigenens]GIJ50835.1 flagellar protein FliS [Virgisporangium aliadipatigenens]
MTSPAMRARYLNDSIATASPARLLVMLYERLVVDLSQAETALGAGDRETADDRLKHAQEIVIELRTSLRLDLWEGATDLARIYGFLLGEMISANIRADVEKVVSCRKLVEPLLDAWRQASLISAEPAA